MYNGNEVEDIVDHIEWSGGCFRAFFGKIQRFFQIEQENTLPSTIASQYYSLTLSGWIVYSVILCEIHLWAETGLGVMSSIPIMPPPHSPPHSSLFLVAIQASWSLWIVGCCWLFKLARHQSSKSRRLWYSNWIGDLVPCALFCCRAWNSTIQSNSLVR